MLRILCENSAKALNDNLPETDNFKRALDATAIHALLPEEMHVKEIYMNSTSTRA